MADIRQSHGPRKGIAYFLPAVHLTGGEAVSPKGFCFFSDQFGHLLGEKEFGIIDPSNAARACKMVI